MLSIKFGLLCILLIILTIRLNPVDALGDAASSDDGHDPPLSGPLWVSGLSDQAAPRTHASRLPTGRSATHLMKLRSHKKKKNISPGRGSASLAFRTQAMQYANSPQNSPMPTPKCIGEEDFLFTALRLRKEAAIVENVAAITKKEAAITKKETAITQNHWFTKLMQLGLGLAGISLSFVYVRLFQCRLAALGHRCRI